MTCPIVARPPDERLAPFVSHYWLSRDNAASTHPVLPDGCVDLVIESTESAAHSWLFGTTTARTAVPVTRRGHYLGVRFNPGQSRHFAACPASKLTDTHMATQGQIDFSLDCVAEQMATGDPFAALDAALMRWLERHPPEPHRVDAAVRRIQAHRGNVRIEDVAAHVGISRRHLERLFLAHVGVSPKCFARIRRCYRTLMVLTSQSHRTLAEAALDMGYADQSHMTRELKRLTGETPHRLSRGDVAFVQDVLSPEFEVGDAHSPNNGATP